MDMHSSEGAEVQVITGENLSVSSVVWWRGRWDIVEELYEECSTQSVESSACMAVEVHTSPSFQMG